tara:strand:+ start:141 stop:503 length:363 start_codon:yes stop_codon:yes gene_type:complete
MAKCLECGESNLAGVNFCTKCRAKIILECPKCGFKSPQGSEFCGSCGAETDPSFTTFAMTEAAAAEARKTRVKNIAKGGKEVVEGIFGLIFYGFIFLIVIGLISSYVIAPVFGFVMTFFE